MDPLDADKKLLERIELDNKLMAHGYHREKCDRCNGTGYLDISPQNVYPYGSSLPCSRCQRRGERWVAPITK